MLCLSLSQLNDLEEPVTQRVVIQQIDNHAIKGFSMGTGFIGWCTIKAEERSLNLTMTKDGEICKFSLNVNTLFNTVEQCEMVVTRVHNFSTIFNAKDFVFVNVSGSTKGIECQITSGNESTMYLQWSLKDNETPLLGGCHDLRSSDACATNDDCTWDGQICIVKTDDLKDNIYGGCEDLRSSDACATDDDCKWDGDVCLKKTDLNNTVLGGCHDMLTAKHCSEFQGSIKCFWNGNVCKAMSLQGLKGGCHDLWNQKLCSHSNKCQWTKGGCHQRTYTMLGGGCHDLWNQKLCSSSNQCQWTTEGGCQQYTMLGGCHDLRSSNACATNNDCTWNDDICIRKMSLTRQSPLLGGCHDLHTKDMCSGVQECLWSNGTCQTVESVGLKCSKNTK